MNGLKKICGLFLLIFCHSLFAQPITPDQIPPDLQPWQAWVLYDTPEYNCPFLYTQQTDRYCAWPAQLALNVDKDKIYFNQTWQVFAPSIVPLPGDETLWPIQVTANGKPYPVIAHEQTPVMELIPGVYQIQGYLPYVQQPESVKIPAHTGLVQLVQQGAKVNHPRLTDDRLWLSQTTHEFTQQALQIRVFRKINQSVPVEVQTHIEIDASGPAREVHLGPVLLPETTPLRLDSPLPAQLDDNGLLRVQLRPGKWTIEITERFFTPVERLKRAEVGPPWPLEEIWSFDLNPQLGLLTVSGVPTVDPTQTLMPEAWRQLPSYRVRLADSVLLTHTRDTLQQHNQLQLTRHMWLNFAGDFWTVEDALQGQMVAQWRLALTPPFALGRFSLNETDQLITVLENAQGEKIPGVEIRQGQLSAQATSLIENTWHFPINGWSETLTSIHTTLSLPPGWQLLTAVGAEQISGHVLSQWSLFDLFMIALTSLVLMTVLDKKWGFLAFLMLVCTYQQAHWFIVVWLNIILALALVQFIKLSPGSRMAIYYREASFAVLAVAIIAVSASSLVASLYPQTKAHSNEPVVAEAVALQSMDARPMSRKENVMKQPLPDVFAVPVDAKTQTGPAQPQWEWTQIQLDWQTPVSTNNNVYLLLISPLMQQLFTLLSIILLISVAWQLWRQRLQPLTWNLNLRPSKHLSWVLIVGLSVLNAPAHANEIPDPALLETFKNRLLAAPECLPQCASMGEATIKVNADELMLQMQVHAAANVAIPIPGRSTYWQAEQVFMDGMPTRALFWQDNTLMVYVPVGTHTVVVQGQLSEIDKVSLEFPLNPHWLTVNAPGWFVEGLNERQLLGNTLHLLRSEQRGQNETAGIAPFVRVIRDLSLGLNGEVSTRVVRVAPVTGAIQLHIPLLSHESVVTPGIEVQDNQVLVQFSPNQQEVVWQSTIDQYNDLTLFAPQTDAWTEEWMVAISPVWHPMITGIPALSQSSYNSWQAHWQPWPLESVHIQLQRPQAMSGSSVTVEQVNVLTQFLAGHREVNVQALLRATLAGQQKLILPENISLESVRVNGIAQGGLQGREVTLAYSPGNNWVDLTWRSQSASDLWLQTPTLDWKMPVYNIHLGLNGAHDRWVLALGGSGYGPVLLYGFWVLAAVILAVLLALMKTSLFTRSQWLLLTVGLSMLAPLFGLWVIAAFVLLGLYAHTTFNSRFWQQLAKILCLLLVLGALLILAYAMIHGLKDKPNSQLVSSALSTQIVADYVWLQDFSADVWPTAWIVSVPMWVYRLAVLLWSFAIILLLVRFIPKVGALIRKPVV